MALPTIVADLGPGWEGAHITAASGKIVVAHKDHPALMIDVAERIFTALFSAGESWPSRTTDPGKSDN